MYLLFTFQLKNCIMKKNIMLCAFLLLALFLQAQDVITKTDGTILKGKVISFQNNRLVIQQEDETEMTLPRKAIAEIKFDYAQNKSVTAKGDIKPEATTIVVIKT